jgi:hypothetical protein
MGFYKLAQYVEMSLDVPTSDKKIARKAVQRMQILINKLNAFNKHLDIIYTPFENNPIVSKESVLEVRGTIRRYRDQIDENLTELKKIAFPAIQDLNFFGTDTHISELVKSFDDSFGDFEKYTQELLEILDEIKSERYRELVMAAIEKAIKQGAELEKLLTERIIDHINTNIIASSWIDSVSDTIHSTIQEREPYIKQLHKEREEQLRNMMNKR